MKSFIEKNSHHTIKIKDVKEKEKNVIMVTKIIAIFSLTYLL